MLLLDLRSKLALRIYFRKAEKFQTILLSIGQGKMYREACQHANRICRPRLHLLE